MKAIRSDDCENRFRNLFNYEMFKQFGQRVFAIRPTSIQYTTVHSTYGQYFESKSHYQPWASCIDIVYRRAIYVDHTAWFSSEMTALLFISHF